jgi:hypothetical protein
MYKVGAKPKSISWGTLESLACWGLNEKSANNKKIIGFIVRPGARVDVQVAAKAAVAVPVVQLPGASTTKSSAVEAELNKLSKVNWAQVGSDALDVAQDAAAAASKETTTMGKIGAWFKYVAANTKIDEMLLDALRTFLTVSISVALGLGIPLLDISGGDFRTILSAGLASALSVAVKALDPNQSEYGISRK